MRLILGFGLGGEWGGAMLLNLENFQKKRGFYSSFVQATVGIGLLIGVFIFMPLVYYLPHNLMISYGWRIPFLLSFVIVIIGVFIRLKINETPLFMKEKEKNTISKSPFKTLMKKHWKGVLLGTVLAGSSGNFFYFAISLLPVLFESAHKITVFDGLIGTAIFGIVDIIFVFIGGKISDKNGRRITIAAANTIALIVIYPSIYLISPIYFIIFLTVFGIAHGLSYAPLGAMISEIFPTDVRYSGNSAAYQYGNSFIGGPAPYVSDYFGGIFYFLYPVFTVIFILIALYSIYRTKESMNSLLGQYGLELPKIALITTRGFKDVIEIGRQNRPELYNLNFHRPKMLVPERFRYEVNERTDISGYIIKDLNVEDLREIVKNLEKNNIKSIGICFLHSYKNPENELKAKK